MEIITPKSAVAQKNDVRLPVIYSTNLLVLTRSIWPARPPSWFWIALLDTSGSQSGQTTCIMSCESDHLRLHTGYFMCNSKRCFILKNKPLLLVQTSEVHRNEESPNPCTAVLHQCFWRCQGKKEWKLLLVSNTRLFELATLLSPGAYISCLFLLSVCLSSHSFHFLNRLDSHLYL